MPAHDTAFWHASLSTDFRCADRLVHVAITGMSHDTGEPIVDIAWSSRPSHLTETDMSEFDARKAAAIITLQSRMWHLLERSA